MTLQSGGSVWFVLLVLLVGQAEACWVPVVSKTASTPAASLPSTKGQRGGCVEGRCGDRGRNQGEEVSGSVPSLVRFGSPQGFEGVCLGADSFLTSPKSVCQSVDNQ